jgi:hypothetical protein
MANKKSKKQEVDTQAVRTAANKSRRQARNDRRMAKMVERTQGLIGQHVQFRAQGRRHPLVGTVTDVLRNGDEGYPEPWSRSNTSGSKRKYGAFIKIRTPEGSRTVSRHRVKLVKKEK